MCGWVGGGGGGGGGNGVEEEDGGAGGDVVGMDEGCEFPLKTASGSGWGSRTWTAVAKVNRHARI